MVGRLPNAAHHAITNIAPARGTFVLVRVSRAYSFRCCLIDLSYSKLFPGAFEQCHSHVVSSVTYSCRPVYASQSSNTSSVASEEDVQQTQDSEVLGAKSQVRFRQVEGTSSPIIRPRFAHLRMASQACGNSSPALAEH